MAKKFFNYHNKNENRDNRDNRDSRNDRNNNQDRQGGQFFDRKSDQKNDKQNQNQNQRENDRDNKRKDFYQKKSNFVNQSDKNQDNDKRYNDRPNVVEKKEVFGKCFICDSNVADEIYSLSIGDEDKKYFHFECMVKKVKQKAQKDFPKVNNYKVYYLGDGTFAAVIEKHYKGMQWEILFKMNIKELLPIPVSDLQKSTN